MFAADANFQLCCFTGNAWFRSAKFLEYATFEQATFHAEADFFAVASSHGLLISKAKFIEVPQFNQANFKEALDLDAVDYPIPGFLNRTLTASPMHYRALRRFAQEGHDIENETKAFKGEIRSKRGTEDKIWHAAFWIGVLYDAVSDFGRSILRPFLIWAISIPLFTVAYLAHAGKLATIAAGCSSGSYVIKALLFALKNAVLFVSWDREQIRSAYVCLYDLQSAAQNFAVPPTNAFLQAVQSVWSAVLIFLFLLAVRNQFRIK
jgi:hypothetical protein